MRTTRQRLFGGWLVAFIATGATLTGVGAARAQVADYAVPGIPQYNVPIPTGKAGDRGIYVGFEFMLLTQTRALGDQLIATRGLIDARGLVSGGPPGTYVGSGAPALRTDDLPRRSYSPGFTLTMGYKFDEGASVYLSYTHLLSHSSHAGATQVPQFFRSGADLADSFVTAPVFNFPPQFAGPGVKTSRDDINGNGVIDAGEGGNFYGIWNGASVMDIQFDQWYNAADIAVRMPLFQTEYSRIYGLAGGRFAMFMERFRWRTVSFDINGVAGPQDAATYSNTLSQRMYGPFLGCGHEAYVGNAFGISLDLSAAALLNVIKERAKYKLGDNTIQNKISRDEFGIVPNVNANLNLTWYPLEGVQMRVGYNAMTYFNTMYMKEPVGFNYSSIDPAYETKGFRILHGVNVGLGIFF